MLITLGKGGKVVGIRPAGKGRAAGVIDVKIAATAVQHRATVLHYDSEYDHIHDAYPDLSTRWIVPRGTTD